MQFNQITIFLPDEIMHELNARSTMSGLPVEYIASLWLSERYHQQFQKSATMPTKSRKKLSDKARSTSNIVSRFGSRLLGRGGKTAKHAANAVAAESQS